MMIKKTIKQVFCKLIWAITKINSNQVVFSSFSGKSYSDNPKAISEKLHEIDTTICIVWLNNGRDLIGLPPYAKQVSTTNLISYYRTLASSKVVVENFGFNNIPKKKGQHYIQTWHGDRAFKKVLYDSTFGDGSLFLPESVDGFCDLAVAGSDYGEKQYRSAFHYNGKILKVGTPRDDVLLHADAALISETKKNIGLEEETKYLLYAPTLRRVNQNNREKQSIQAIDLLMTLSVLERQYGGKWKCLIRAHPGVTGLKWSGMDDKSIIDVSEYPDMTNLMVISDALITDYSSCAGDFALLRRPIFLFQDDIKEYLKKDRTFYFDMNESPYYIAHSQEELNRMIASTTLATAAQNCEEILKFYGTNETGEAARTVARIITAFCNE